MRKLASIQKIKSLEPIENADSIEKAIVLGWECVVKKGEFNIEDLCVYCEIDSVLPEKPEFEFLKDRKYRIKTIKLRGQISQGICFPLTILPKNNYNEGDDVTEIIGITKYLSPSERHELEQIEQRIKRDKNKIRKFMMRYSWFRMLFLSRTKKSGFPYWISKTDEERIQNMPWVLEQFKDKYVYVTEKIDYQSGTWTGKIIPRFGGLLGKLLPLKKYQFVVCSRNLTTNNKNSLYWQIAKKYNLEEILRKNPDLTIQGEQGDVGIQGNKYELNEPKMWIFNLIDHQTGFHYNYEEIETFCIDNKLDYVPIIKKCYIKDIGTNISDWVEFSKGKSFINPNIQREGIVVRCVENGQKLLSFKVVNPDFLLKYNE